MPFILTGQKGKKPKAPKQRTPVEAPNTLQSKNVARLIDVLSEGPIEGLVNGNQSVYLDDTVLENNDGTLNFKGVTIEARTGEPDQDALTGFPYIENEVNVGVLVQQASPVVRTVTDTDINRLRIKIRTPALSYQNITNGDLLGTEVQFNIEIQPNGGSYQTISQNFTSTTISGTQSDSNATGLSVTVQDEVSGFAGTVQTATLTAQYRAVGDVSWLPLGTRDVSVTIPLPAESRALTDDTHTSLSGVRTQSVGSAVVSATFDISGLTADQYEFRATAGTIVSASQTVYQAISISGKTTSAYEVSYSVDLPDDAAPFNIRVTRITADSDVATLQNDIYFSTYTKIIDAKLIYPDSALIGITFDAELFGQDVPNRAYEFKGLKINIPSNYDPITREYTGIWDGTFTLAWSNNPAWVLYDLLTNIRYGLGQSIDPEQVSKFNLYDIGVYCDELVDDGFGGTEPRFTFNAVINTQREAYEVINAIASAFRGMVFWQTGTISVVQDGPTEPTKLVNTTNVINGRFDYSGTALKARHTAALVTWNDPNDSYKAAIEVVQDADLIDRFGWRQVDTVAFGCTSRGQAHRFGKWILDSEQYETETVSYQASLDHADVRPGDIVLVLDPFYAGVRNAGRIITPGTTSIVIDEAITIEAGETYSVFITLPDGSLEERTLTNVVGSPTTLTWTSALSDTPLTGATWVITASNVEPRKFRVLNVRETEKHIYEITALFYDENKYARVESNVVLESPDYSALPQGALKAPTDLQITEYLFQAGPSVKSAVTLSWDAARDARVGYYEIEFKGPSDSAFRYHTPVSGTSVDFLDTIDGTWQFRIRAADRLGGLRSEYLEGTFELGGLAIPPANVENFNINVIGDVAYLTWNPVADLDLEYYQLKFSNAQTGATWGTSSLLQEKVPKNTTAWAVSSSLIGSFLIKAVDTSGVFSENETIITTNIGAILNLNAVDLVDESASFPGTNDQTVVVDGELRLSNSDFVDDWTNWDDIGNIDAGTGPISTVGAYYFENCNTDIGSAVDLGGIYTSRITANVEAFGSDLYDNIDLVDNFDAIENMDGADPSAWEWKLFIRYTNDDPLGTPTWSDWLPLIVGDYTARAFQFRINLYSYQWGITPVISTLQVNVDMPDRVDGQNDILTNAAGSTITFSPAFKATPAIGIAAQDMATDDRVAITAKSATSFTIRFYNAAGAGIAKTFDWVAKGYGYVSTGIPIVPTGNNSFDFTDSDNSMYIPLI